MWAEESGALCLRWMDPDSGTTLAYKPMSGLNGFPLLICSSISISVLPLLLSSEIHSISASVLQPFFFHNYEMAFFHFFSFIPNVPSPLFIPLPSCCWHRDAAEKEDRVEQLDGFIIEINGNVLSTQRRCHTAYFKTPSFLHLSICTAQASLRGSLSHGHRVVSGLI